MERIPRPGEFYRHFKDKLYQVTAVAEHTETGETLVVYQALYGDFRIYARPLAMFTSEVDHEKYPDAIQKYRFERVEFVYSGKKEVAETPEPAVKTDEFVTATELTGLTADIREDDEESVPLNPGLLSFIEADTYEGRLEALHQMKGKVSQEDLGIIYVALDLKKVEGSVDAQLEAVEQILSMQRHYDGGHLR